MSVENVGLRGLDFRGRTITDAIGKFDSLERADFRGAQLFNVELAGISLRSALSENATLEGTNLAGADLRGPALGE